MGQNACSCCAEERNEIAEKDFGALPAPVHFQEDLREPAQATDDCDMPSPFCEDDATQGPAHTKLSGLASATLISPGRSSPSRAEVLGSTSPLRRVPTREDRLEQGAQLYVDSELVRSISLESTLWGCGWLWRVRPAQMSQAQLDALWRRSAEADAFDVFLSHAWSTPGHQKYLSLLLSSGWQYALLAWAFAATLVMTLYILNVLPRPMTVSRNEDLLASGEARMAPWGYLSTFVFALSGLACAPHMCSSWRRTPGCFYDVACVNQGDPEQRERGIYGIGGFLAITKQLRILWSPPYLSRLWCVPFLFSEQNRRLHR